MLRHINDETPGLTAGPTRAVRGHDWIGARRAILFGQPGQNVIIAPAISDQAAKRTFRDDPKSLKRYFDVLVERQSCPTIGLIAQP